MTSLEITTNDDTQKITLDTSGRGHLEVTDKRGKAVCVCLGDFSHKSLNMLTGVLGLFVDGEDE